ncbi:hypothetical protein JCM33374_g5840 [Metschnikowia sp. JCM 33374]|nr:hypothetical protein JCM33374_g5840 [Metschnikowia sp. JCM 33374]
MTRGISWDFEDVRNESPLKQTITPVLPFSQHKLEYYASYSFDGQIMNSIELPQLQVYDMHYKIGLPTVSLQSSVKVTESGMILIL